MKACSQHDISRCKDGEGDSLEKLKLIQEQWSGAGGSAGASSYEDLNNGDKGLD